MITEKEAFDILANAGAHCLNKKILIPVGTDPEKIRKIKENKPDLLYYCDGEYFRRMLIMHIGFCRWAVLKKSNMGGVHFPPKTVFEGTAHEVDLWCKKHADDPLFTDEYTLKYTVVWEKSEEDMEGPER